VEHLIFKTRKGFVLGEAVIGLLLICLALHASINMLIGHSNLIKQEQILLRARESEWIKLQR